MHWPKFLAALVGASLLPVQPVFAHGFAGPHMFISTLLIDDPNVADEASLPTFSFLPQPTEDGVSPGLYNVSFEFDKRITENFGFSSAMATNGCTRRAQDRQRVAEPGGGAEVQGVRQSGAGHHAHPGRSLPRRGARCPRMWR